MSGKIWLPPLTRGTIRRLMAEREMSEFALAIKTDISPALLSDILNGEIKATIEELEAIAKALGTTAEKLRG